MYRCDACGNEFGPAGPWRCTCGHALDYADRPLPDGDAPAFGDLDVRAGLWAFAAFLPVRRRVTLGEGWTPLVDAPGWDASFKLDYCVPTGSFKDRGAATTVSQAVAAGADRVLEDSSGNAGAAIATYAARAGLDAEIYVPAGAKAGTLRAIERTGADVVRVEGDRQTVTDACVAAVESGAGYYASHAYDPAFLAGTATAAYELAAQRDWSVPDAVVTPLGHGTMLLGLYRGFAALSAAGWTDGVPRLCGVQAAGVAPVAERLHGPTDGHNEVADGIQIARPARETQILAAIEDSSGDAVAVGAAATERERDRLARAGFQVEPTCAVATAGLKRLREDGVVDENASVVVVLTGSAGTA